MEALTRRQEQNPEQPKRACRNPIIRPSRQQLLFEFDLVVSTTSLSTASRPKPEIVQRQAQDPGSLKQQYFLCDPYPPSTKNISELSPISISELNLDTHHRGKVLFARIIDTALRVAAVHSIVQDDMGAAERLALYNTDVAIKAEELLPEDAILAIKEPYYVANPNRSYSLRVDHPSDLVQLSPLDTRVPRGLCVDLTKADKSALDWKNEGNLAYSAENYLAALQAYSQGLDTCSVDDTTIKYDLLRNRAIVNICLKRFEQAMTDAKAAIIPAKVREDDEGNLLNSKAYERAGRAAYGLGRFQEAQVCFKKMQELASTNRVGFGALERIEQRRREWSSGDYDFMMMSRSANKKHNRLDHADFISNTTIRETGAHGRGTFATTDIAAGQLVLCEKAMCIAFDSDETPQSYTILNHNTKRALAGAQATLLFTLSQKLVHSPELAVELFDLFDGGYHPKTSLQTVEGLVPVDTFRTQAIIEYNCFECPTVRSSSRAAQKQANSRAGYHSTGLWLRASYINHACDGNALRSFIGDMMIVRATRDIVQGEEIKMPYRLPDAINVATQAELEKTWGFKCDCDLCIAEAASSPSQRRYRSQLIEKMRGLLSVSPLSPQYQHNKSSLAQVEKLFAKLENTYDGRSFEKRPRLGLVAPGLWLCQVYKYTGSHDKVMKTAMALFQNLGFIITVAGQTVSIDRRHCQLEGNAIYAAMYAAHAFYSRGDAGIGHQMEEFARSVYMIMNGEARGFEDRYKDL